MIRNVFFMGAFALVLSSFSTQCSADDASGLRKIDSEQTQNLAESTDTRNLDSATQPQSSDHLSDHEISRILKTIDNPNAPSSIVGFNLQDANTKTDKPADAQEQQVETLSITAIPEPSTWVFAALGLAILSVFGIILRQK
jgi:hypothetical protein